MQSLRIGLFFAVLTFSAGMDSPLFAGGRVQVELVGEARDAAISFQRWMQALSQAGITNVRIRSAESADKVGIEERGSDANRLYIVTGVVNSSDELLMPSGRVRRGDLAQLAIWLDELARLGPEEEREPPAAFGLTGDQLAEVRKDLARSVGLATAEMTRAEAVEKIGRRLSLPLWIEPAQAKTLAATRVGEDLSAFACGTALAHLLRPAGLGLLPRQTDRGGDYVLVDVRPDKETWPVGWEPEKPWPELLPDFYEMRNVTIQNIAASKALEAIAGRLKVPVLMDHRALARHAIDPAKELVSHPSGRSNYSMALNKILFQAGLKFDLRVDEAAKAFLWVTSVKPL